MTVEQFPLGTPVHGELQSTDARTAAVLVLTSPVASNPATALVQATTERLALTGASVSGPVTMLLTSLFFDNDPITSALTPITFVDGGGGEDTVSFAGDLANMFRTGRSFTIANDADNDGSFTSTGATFDSGTNRTTVNVATGSWSGVTSDGDITANPTITAGHGIIKADKGVEPDVRSWPIGAMRIGPYGHGVFFIQSVAGDRTDVMVDGFKQTQIVKTAPLARQAGSGAPPP